MSLRKPKILGGGTKVLTEAELDEDDKANASVPIEYTVGAAFTVKLPTSITLEKGENGYSYTGTVGVKGDIDSGKVVYVTPDSSITMYDVTNRPTEDVPSGEDDQDYAHKTAKAVEGALGKKYWAQTELSADEFSDAVLTYEADTMQSGIWKGKLGVEIEYGRKNVELTAGQTYTLGGYSWVAAEVNEKYTVLQSTGVTLGPWPGYTMSKYGNWTIYYGSIDGQNISSYDTKMTNLYDNIKSAEYTDASYGNGLYLISYSMGMPSYRNGIYHSTMRKVCSLYPNCLAYWLGTPKYPEYNQAACQISVGSEGAPGSMYQKYNGIIAPAFNLDTTKVVLDGTALTVVY